MNQRSGKSIPSESNAWSSLYRHTPSGKSHVSPLRVQHEITEAIMKRGGAFVHTEPVRR